MSESNPEDKDAQEMKSYMAAIEQIKFENPEPDWFDDSNFEYTNLKLFSQWDIPPNHLVRDAHLLGQLRKESQPLNTDFTVPEQDKDADIYMDAFSKSDDNSDQSDGEGLSSAKGGDSSGLASFMDIFKAKAKAQYDQTLEREESGASKIVDEPSGTEDSMKSTTSSLVTKGSSSSAIEQYKAKVRELELKNYRPDVLNPKKEFAGIELENQTIDIGKQLALPGFGKKKKRREKDSSSPSQKYSDDSYSGLPKRPVPVVKKFGLAKALQILKEEESPLMQSDIEKARENANLNIDRDSLSKVHGGLIQASDKGSPSKQIYTKMLKKQEKKQKKKSGKGLDLLAISQLGLD